MIKSKILVGSMLLAAMVKATPIPPPINYEFHATIGQMAFDGTFTYYQGILESVNVSDGFNNSVFTDAFTSGSMVTFDDGTVFLTFWTSGGGLGTQETILNVFNLNLNEGGNDHVVVCGSKVACTASLVVQGTVVPPHPVVSQSITPVKEAATTIPFTTTPVTKGGGGAMGWLTLLALLGIKTRKLFHVPS